MKRSPTECQNEVDGKVSRHHCRQRLSVTAAMRSRSRSARAEAPPGGETSINTTSIPKATRSLPRALVVFVLREQAHLTYKEIGRLLGDRSHTSDYLMYKKYEEDIRQEPDLIAVIKESGRRMLATG